MISVLIGTNDLKENISEEEFEIAYNQLVVKLKLLCRNNHILLIRIPAFPAGVMYPYHFNMNKKIDGFNSIIDKISSAHRLKTFRFDIANEHFFDGVHLNDHGSKTCGSQLAMFILNDKGFSS